LPPSFVVRSLQIAADMRLAHASLGDKIPAASCYLYLFPPPKRAVSGFLPRAAQAANLAAHGMN